ncbi:hypothetical protein Agabi119p4_7302 [Agaricus bisporus var. burnettii]|uniref:Nephrocystin 3-like N-terminal domain-containing protein n=1 Tax=Agaricus bisporus var. burnettii TaxID=192524 RepID=A0A8H7C8R0_AGABI|nr:hypothetical protein Agabi119p4_7302 [Agaricus bisporus var. burnettii]
MSHNEPSTDRSPHSPRYSRYSRFPDPEAFALRSPIPPPPSIGHTERSSDGHISPASAYHYPSTSSTFLQSSTYSMTDYFPNPPFRGSQPINATRPYTSIHQLDHPTYQEYSSAQQPTHFAWHPFPQSLYHHSPAADIPCPDPAHSLPSSSPVQPSLSRYTRYQGQGMFSGSRNMSFSDNTFIDNSITSDNFMDNLLQHTIIGAEFDSSDRHPPPRCHPGTRLAILERCKVFIAQCNGEGKMRWVVGAAGVGKSAIMQIVAEEPPVDVILGASVFLSVNGRQDGRKIFTTIAYQLAAKCEVYCQFVRNQISRDPNLLRKSLPAQFQKFIVDPFVHQRLFNPSQRFLIIIDGLDECDDPLTQQELLGLISDFCIKYPSSPIVWLVASRPEPHITSFFDDVRVVTVYTKEEIKIDSDEACEDVQRYLRNELSKVKLAYPTLKHKREWPSELEFTKIATASGGLFAYASTVIRYIGDPHYRDPAAQLRRVLEVINGGSKDGVLGRDHPMAQLDALYRRILFNIPPDVMVNTRKLLLIYSEYGWHRAYFRSTCNILGLTEDAAYGAVCHLHAVAKVPAPENADNEGLEFLHKSFPDFLIDFERSGFSLDFEDEANQFQAQTLFRVVEQVPDNFSDTESGEAIECGDFGYLKGGSNCCGKISLSWPGDERYQLTDDQLRLRLYSKSVDSLCYEFHPLSDLYWSMPCFHILTVRFTAPGYAFPIEELRDSAFEQFRPELKELGKFRQVPLRTLDYAAICGRVDLRFVSPVGIDTKLSDPWNPSCMHYKFGPGNGDDLQQRRGWVTSFWRYKTNPGAEVTHADIPRFNIEAGQESHWKSARKKGYRECPTCLRRFAHQFHHLRDQLTTVFIDSTEMSYVEFSFVDADDGVSEWRYRFFHSGRPSCLG